MSLPIYISDPVGSRYRKAADHSFIVDNMHMPIYKRLRAAGLEPVKKEALTVLDSGKKASLEGFGGLILLGGFDIDSIFYSTEVNIARFASGFSDVDAYELNLIYEAVTRGLPILGICRGLQLLNVFFGGTLHSDISHLATVQHNNFGAQAYGARATVHGAKIQGSSALEDGEYKVSSSHHQAVDKLGTSLIVTGYSEDGIIEMIEEPGRGIVGVQWHPESKHVPQSDTLTPLIANFSTIAKQAQEEILSVSA